MAQPQLGVLFSGGGRSLENLGAVIREGKLEAEIAAAISSHPQAAGVERARRLGIPTEVVDWRVARDRFSELVAERLDAARVDLVVMAGLIRHWTIPERYRGRVLNIHPALLPAFGGKGFWGEHVHAAVLRAGAKFSGCTVHFVDDLYDHGPIVLQRVVPVRDDDTPESLASRVFAAECVAYPEAIRLVLEGRVEVRDGRARIKAAEEATL